MCQAFIDLVCAWSMQHTISMVYAHNVGFRVIQHIATDEPIHLIAVRKAAM